MYSNFPVKTGTWKPTPFPTDGSTPAITFPEPEKEDPSTRLREFAPAIIGYASESTINCIFNPIPFSNKKYQYSKDYHRELQYMPVFRVRRQTYEAQQQHDTAIKKQKMDGFFPKYENLMSIQQLNFHLAHNDIDLTLKDVFDRIALIFTGIKPKNLFEQMSNGDFMTKQAGTVSGIAEVRDLWSKTVQNKHDNKHSIRENDQLYFVVKKISYDSIANQFFPSLSFKDNDLENVRMEANRPSTYVWQVEPFFTVDNQGPKARDLQSAVIKDGKKFAGFSIFMGHVKEIKMASHFRMLAGGELLPNADQRKVISRAPGASPQRSIFHALTRQQLVIDFNILAQGSMLPEWYDPVEERELMAATKIT